jgi:putative hydrolase of the HAD superfamily
MRAPVALCFDLDNTLWNIEPVIEQAERGLHQWLATEYPRITERYSIDDMRARRLAVAVRRPDLAHDFTSLRKLALGEHASEAGYPPAMVEHAFEEFYRLRNQVEPYEDVLPALDRLRVRYRLLTLTNGNADLARIGLAHYFELQVSARAAGYAKPDARIFSVLLASAALAAEDLVYVGDEPIADIHGARSAGIDAVWINRRGAEWPAELAPPLHTVCTLHELADWLDAGGPAQARP